jgi:hypothetical protein
MVKVLMTLILLTLTTLAGTFGDGGHRLSDPDFTEVSPSADPDGNDGGPMVDPDGSS